AIKGTKAIATDLRHSAKKHHAVTTSASDDPIRSHVAAGEPCPALPFPTITALASNAAHAPQSPMNIRFRSGVCSTGRSLLVIGLLRMERCERSERGPGTSAEKVECVACGLSVTAEGDYGWEFRFIPEDSQHGPVPPTPSLPVTLQLYYRTSLRRI